jgi:hypothetical protein
LSVESGKVSHTVTQVDEIFLEDHCPRDHGAGEGLGGVEVVGRSPPGRELVCGGFDPNHAERNRRTLGLE